MKRIHKAREDAGFIRAVAAALFLAACAYMGAALYEGLNRELETALVQRVTLTDSLELQGLAVRREQLVCSQTPATLLARDGGRLPCGGALASLGDGTVLTAPCSALFYSDCDGLESLSPDMLRPLTVQSLEALFETEPSDACGALGRLVTDYSWYYAAFADTSDELPAVGDCRVKFDGMEQAVSAELVSVHTEGDRAALLLRLSCGGSEYMSLRMTGAELIFSEHTGLELPVEAVGRAADGTEFVYTLTAGLVERKAVEIIYTAGERCIAAISPSANALREGNTLIVSGKDIYEGRIVDS